MYDVIVNSGFIGFLIWTLLFATSTAAAALVIRCVWILRRKRFASPVKLMPLLKCMPSEPHGEGDIAVELWKKLELGENDAVGRSS